MALQSYTLAVGNLKDDESGNNYAINKPVYILDRNGNQQPIFSDLDGNIPIIQDGFNNSTDELGRFTFYVEAGDYTAKVAEIESNFTVVGSDYFNNKVDDAVDLIIDAVAGRGAYYVVGSFESGFTYTDINQVGTYNNSGTLEYYVYTGGLSNLPHAVPAGANPTNNSDYQRVVYDKVTQESGNSTSLVMSQNASTNADFLARKKAIEDVSGGKNSLFLDDQGNENVMVWINKFNSEDINQAIIDRHGWDPQLGTGVFPAFIKNGVQIAGFWYGKYQASNGDNGGCSVVSGVQPKVYVDYDIAKSLCTSKGAGWHLSANIEWMAVAFLGLAFGDEPRGNTNYGRAYDAKHETMKRSNPIYAPGDTALIAADLCGTGSVHWSHDGTQFGVFDMVGNIWEWQDQLKLKEGQLFAPPDNNPDMFEVDWPSYECYFDSSGITSGSVILNSLITNRTGDIGDNGNGNGSNSNTWRTTAKDPSYVENLLMRQMGIEPPPDAILNGSLYSRNFGERMPFRGGIWSSTSAAGLGALNFGYSRAAAYSSLGFRPALFEV